MSKKKIDVKKIREKLGVSQEKFGEMLGVHYKTIQNYEKGGAIPDSKIPMFQKLLKGNEKQEPSQNFDLETAVFDLQKSIKTLTAKIGRLEKKLATERKKIPTRSVPRTKKTA